MIYLPRHYEIIIFISNKVTSRISNDFFFSKLKSVSEQCSNLLLWDNKNDIYEVFDKIDVAIVDYSSIYYDLVAAGVKKFIRYIFDYEEESKFLIYDYFENTSGVICRSFNELINSLQQIKEIKTEEETLNIYNKFWEYEDNSTLDDIIDKTLSFNVTKDTLPSLYSFDLFDTVLARKCLLPQGVFLQVMQKIQCSTVDFPIIFKKNYKLVRAEAENNVREYFRKSLEKEEITFDLIFKRLSDVYDLNEEQICLLKKWELEAELENVIGIEENVEKVLELLSENQKVIFISDMYLPSDFIKQMIHKVNPKLCDIPVFVSCEYGAQKTTGHLYWEVYKKFIPWPFKEWHHFGDNLKSDIESAKKMGIITHPIKAISPNNFEKFLIKNIDSYEGYLLVDSLARTRNKSFVNIKDYFAFSHISAYLVPYVIWSVQKAIEKKFEHMYFISRDGYF